MGELIVLNTSNDGKEEKTAGGVQVLNSADLAFLISSSETSAGVSVSISSAIRMATVWACVRLLAESIAQLPCHVYVKNRDGSKSRVTDTALAELLSFSPNGWMTPFEYTEFMITSLAMRGNHYAFKSLNSKSEVLELIPFQPGSVRAERRKLSDIRYHITIDGSPQTFSQDEITHVRGLTFDGFMGVSPVTHHRETIGLAMAAGQYGARLFKNGARPSGVITMPNEISDNAYERLLKSWNEKYGGANIGKTAILEQGGDFKTISMSNEDAQYLEVRQFQRTEICSIYRIPPHMIGDLTKSSFSNITQQSLEFVKYTILPWCRRVEMAMHRDLMTPAERKRGMFVEYVVDGLERADIRTRYEAYKTGVNGGWLSPNEVRKKENMNPRPGGDIYLAPLNMVDSSQGMPKPEKRLIKAAEFKGVESREALRLKFKDRFNKIAALVVKAETGMVRTIIESQKSVPENIQEQLDDIYSQFPARIESSFRALVREYGVAVRKAALSEAESDNAVDPNVLGDFLDQVLEALAVRHVASSIGQLAALIRDTDPEQLLDVLEQRLIEWEETRPGKIAEREVVQQESSVSRFVWAAVGITRLQWVRRGSESCPFCKDLDGKIVGIEAPFVEHGNYQPEGYQNSPWKIRGPKLHGPIHRGCRCVIVPVRD
ncbi:phage portal protein [Desulfopila aestuarii]|uniref:Phage portal protein, HK97 family n=1 Tax=Desulfopila aestuarii DSM 18488 TaxID=1121416 RepID=A0A1M7YJQ2_9BACT|nr:phage portal protein [Desulfopila aestuarii]SHO52861.1 phage portal protein, HK97 family [Desulfopila aestuarii DSM 18488]